MTEHWDDERLNAALHLAASLPDHDSTVDHDTNDFDLDALRRGTKEKIERTTRDAASSDRRDRLQPSEAGSSPISSSDTSVTPVADGTHSEVAQPTAPVISLERVRKGRRWFGPSLLAAAAAVLLAALVMTRPDQELETSPAEQAATSIQQEQVPDETIETTTSVALQGEETSIATPPPLDALPQYALCPSGPFDLPGVVHQVEFTPDGGHLVVTNINGEAILVNPTTGQVERTFLGHTGGVIGAAINPDGTLLATAGSSDGSARIWDLSTGITQHTLAHPGADSGILFRTAISPDGELLVTTGSDGTAQIWELETGERLRQLENHSGWIMSVGFSPDGSIVALGRDDGVTTLWNPATGAAVGQVGTPTGRSIFTVAFSPDGAQLYTGGDTLPAIWNPETGEQIMAVVDQQAGPVYAADYRFDGRLLAVVGFGDLHLWDPTTGTIVQSFAGYDGNEDDPDGDVYDVAFSPNGDLLATTGPDGDLAIYCSNSGS